jgi:predicted nucleic acid-binding protein
VADVIVLDASVLIGFLDGADDLHGRAVALMAREIDDDFAASPLTLADVLVVPAREGRLDEVREALRDLDVLELPFPADTAAKLARLRADTDLKMPDCCVLLAAEAAAARLGSFDERLVDAAGTRGLVTVRG